jgi:hypothetical protein
MNTITKITAAVAAALCAVGVAQADITINFDMDANGQPIAAPAAFDSASQLRNLYAPLGVHFSGPTSTQGGAILNDSTFALPARSRFNLLALTGIEASEFSGPETISFDMPVFLVSIYASGIGHPYTFTMDAFDAGGGLVGTNSVTTAGFSQLSVASASGIRSVRLSAPSAGINTYVYDDLFASTVPAPASIVLLTGGGVFLLRRRR